MIVKQEELEIVGVQWLGTAHFRKKLPAHVNPSHWDALCRLSDAKTIIAQRDARIAELKSLARIFQTWLGASWSQCDESGQRLWDRIDAALAGGPSFKEL